VCDSGSFAALTISGGAPTKTLPQSVSLAATGFRALFFVKTKEHRHNCLNNSLHVYSLSLVTIFTWTSAFNKIFVKSERFVPFFARERQSDSPRKTSTLRCQMQAQTF
jgi:hypothetical protein